MREFTFSVERTVQKSGVMVILDQHLTPSDIVRLLNEGKLRVQPCSEPGSRGVNILDGERVVATCDEMMDVCEAGDRRFSAWSIES